MKIHTRKNHMGDRRQIVNNAGVGEPRTSRLEVRDRRLPPPYSERKPSYNDTTFSWLNEEDGLFYEWMTNEHDAKKAARMGIPIFFGKLNREGKPKGIQVKP